MPDINRHYEELLKLHKEISLLGSIDSVLQWDQRTYMPENATDHRSDQTSYLASMIHEKRTDPRIGDLLTALEEEGYGGDLMNPQDVNVREWRRDYDLYAKLPKEFVERLTRLTTNANQAWLEARRKQDYAIFKPFLEKIVEMKREEANYYGWEIEPYDAMVDQYEPGMKTEYIETLLHELGNSLVPLIQKISESPNQPDGTILRGKFLKHLQRDLIREITAGIGYRYESGSLDQTTHPFCIGLGPEDTRITTKYEEDFLGGALFGVIHEAGHGIYNQNRSKEYWGLPMGEAASYGIHESQSLLWENIVGRNHAFWEYWYPTVQKYFSQIKDVSLDEFYRSVNEVKPSFIRIDADEVTYHIHIIIRYEIERALMTGEIFVEDVPAEWNKRYQDYLGIKVPNDAIGCLQDIHWSWGNIGYFPSYSLGHLYAAQMFEKARKELGDVESQFQKGDFEPLRQWLTKNVHEHGRRFKPDQLIEFITGRPLSADPLAAYLTRKYEGIYGL